MTLYAGAEWRPLADGHPDATMSAHDIVCVHTMAGYLAGTESMFRTGGWTGVESHFGVGGPADAGHDGAVQQWVDTDFRADANLEGNARLISIETSDGGDETTPWSPAQLDALVDLIVWCCQEYAIPAELVADSAPGRRGIAYHRQGIDPWRVAGGETWSRARGKVCPGDTRIAQLVDEVVPRVQQRLTAQPVPTAGGVRSVDPDTGAAGSMVVVSGYGFETATGLWFGDVPVETWWIDDDNRLTAVVPEPLSSGSVSVSVSSPDGAASAESGAFTYAEAAPPSVSLWSITPDSGAAGSVVVLSGSGFLAATAVWFAEVRADTWSVDDDTQITVTVPEPLTSGGVWVTVASAGVPTEALLFEYRP